MHRIDTDTADPDAHGVGKSGFRNGIAPGFAATDLDADWFNALQEEAANTVEGANLTLVKADTGQLLGAIQALIDRRSEILALSTWTVLFTGATFKAVAVSPDELVAVGNGAAIRRLTPDGVTTPTADTFASDFTDVTWSAAFSRFLACGMADEIQSSPTGATWTRRSDTGDDFYAIAAGLTSAVAVGANGIIKNSPDGTTWSTQTGAHSTADIYDIAYSPTLDRFVAVGAGKTVQRGTASGNTWTAATDVAAIPTAAVMSVVWSHAHAKFIAATSTGTFSSVDGLVWVAEATAASVNVVAVVALKEHVVLFTDTSGSARALGFRSRAPGTQSFHLSPAHQSAGSLTRAQALLYVPASIAAAPNRFAGRVIMAGSGGVYVSGYIP